MNGCTVEEYHNKLAPFLGGFQFKGIIMKETVWLMIREDKPFAIACILKLYALQTAEEKEERDSLVRNGMGFSKGDAQFYAFLVEWFQDPFLANTEPPDHVWREAIRRLEKYSTQLSTFPDIISLL